MASVQQLASPAHPLVRAKCAKHKHHQSLGQRYLWLGCSCSHTQNQPPWVVGRTKGRQTSMHLTGSASSSGGCPRRGAAGFGCVASPAGCRLAVRGRDVRGMASKKNSWPSRSGAKQESAGQQAKRVAKQQRRDRVHPDGLQELAQARHPSIPRASCPDLLSGEGERATSGASSSGGYSASASAALRGQGQTQAFRRRAHLPVYAGVAVCT